MLHAKAVNNIPIKKMAEKKKEMSKSKISSISSKSSDMPKSNVRTRPKDSSFMSRKAGQISSISSQSADSNVVLDVEQSSTSSDKIEKPRAIFSNLVNEIRMAKEKDKPQKPRASFNDVVREIKFSLNDLFFFENLFTAVIIFLAATLVTSIFGFPFWVSLAPAVIYLVLRTVNRARENKIIDVEMAYPNLREKLRTAADTKDDKNNPVVDELQKEIITELKNVQTSSFVNIPKISLMVFLIILLSALITFLPVTGLNFYKLHYKNLGAKIIDSIPINIDKSIFSTKLFSKDNKETDDFDLYGEESLAKLGNKELQFEINPVSFEVSVGEVEEDEWQNLVFERAEGLDDSTKGLSIEKQNVVKKYFQNLIDVEGKK